MNDELLKKFGEAIGSLGNDIFPELVDISLAVPASLDYRRWDILAAMDFSGGSSGTMIYRSTQPVASYLTLVFFGIYVGGDRAAAADGAAEFLNQLFGMVKRGYSGSPGEFDFSLPRRFCGEGILPDASVVVNGFELHADGKRLYLDLCRPAARDAEAVINVDHDGGRLDA